MRGENKKETGHTSCRGSVSCFCFGQVVRIFQGGDSLAGAGHGKDINNNYNVIKIILRKYLSIRKQQIISGYIYGV